MKRSSSEPRVVEHADRRVARARDLARHVERLLQDRVDVALLDRGARVRAACIGTLAGGRPIEDERGGERADTWGRTTDRDCGDAPSSVQESADAG